MTNTQGNTIETTSAQMGDEDPFVTSPSRKAMNPPAMNPLAMHPSQTSLVEVGSDGSSPVVMPAAASVVVLKRGRASYIEVAPSARSSIVTGFKTPERADSGASRRSSPPGSQAIGSGSFQTACSSRCSSSASSHQLNASPGSDTLLDSPPRDVYNPRDDSLTWQNSNHDTLSTTVSELAGSIESLSRSSSNTSDGRRDFQSPRRHPLRLKLRPLSIVASHAMAGRPQPKRQNTDRGQKSMDLIRSIVTTNCPTDTDLATRIEVHLKIVTYELQARLNRIDTLEREAQNAKRDAKTKSIMITGLTRERHSLKRASTADISIVPELQAEIQRNEKEAKSLRETITRLETQLEEKSQQLQASEKAHEETKSNHDSLTTKLESLQGESDSYRDNAKTQVKRHAAEVASIKLKHANDLDHYANRISSMSQQHNEKVATLKTEIEELRLSVRRLAMTSFRKTSRDRISLNVDVAKANTNANTTNTTAPSTTNTDAISLSYTATSAATPSSPSTPSTSIFSSNSFKYSRPANPTRHLAPAPFTIASETQKLQQYQTTIQTLEKRSNEDKELITVLEQALIDVEQQSKLAKAEVGLWREQVLQMKDELMDLKINKALNGGPVRKSPSQRTPAVGGVTVRSPGSHGGHRRRSTDRRRRTPSQNLNQSQSQNQTQTQKLQEENKAARGASPTEVATKELEAKMKIVKNKKAKRKMAMLACF